MACSCKYSQFEPDSWKNPAGLPLTFTPSCRFSLIFKLIPSHVYFDRFDECHKAKNITLDENDNAKMESTENPFDNKGNPASSKTAAAVVELQRRLPRARVVYCSATSVSDPANLGFMSRLGLWGPGTEHPIGFNQFLDECLRKLGMGAMELHALHLKSKGAMLARTLSYSNCEFSLVDEVMNKDMIKMYNDAAALWHDLYVNLMKVQTTREEEREMAKEIERMREEHPHLPLRAELARYDEVNADSDDEGEMTQAEKTAAEYRRKCRNRKPTSVKSLYWVSRIEERWLGFILFALLLVSFSPIVSISLSLSLSRRLPHRFP